MIGSPTGAARNLPARNTVAGKFDVMRGSLTAPYRGSKIS
jgi:hypothetical protein